jgi:hypothetical protein
MTVNGAGEAAGQKRGRWRWKKGRKIDAVVVMGD